MQSQRVEIGMVGDAGIDRCHDADSCCDLFGPRIAECVFGIEEEPVQVRQHAKHRPPGARFQPFETGLEQPDIAAKAVDHEAFHARLLGPAEQLERPHQVREHAPLSMSATRITGQSTASAKPMLAMSRSRRLISAGLPAPSTSTAS